MPRGVRDRRAKMRHGIGAVFLLVVAGAVSGATASDLGLTLKQLPEADLDAIERETGYRVGVYVEAVTAGSAAASDGMRAKDVIFTVWTSGVISPAAVDTALSVKTGSIEVLGMRQGAGGEWEPFRVNVAIPAAVPPPEPEKAAGDAARTAELEQKLAALEKARTAGILTEEEYARKKAEIERELAAAKPAPDAETKARLAALEKAYAAGILTKEEYGKKKAALLGAAKPPAKPAGKKPDPRGRKGQMYQHVVGFRFWYPDGWKVQRQDELLQLIPPDAAMSPEGPKELYLIGGESVAEEGITRPDDPRVIQYFDLQMQSLAPFLKRTAKPKLVKTPFGQGIEMVWEGKSPKGDVIHARILACIMKQSGISLLALGYKDVVAKRDALVRQIFDSFGFGEGQKDPALVGTWSLLKTTGITNQSPFETDWSRARAVSDQKTTLVLKADGTWTRVVDWHMIAIAGGLSMESKDRDVTEGRWNAGNGKLVLVSKGDVWEEYHYRVNGTELRLTGEKQGEIWQKK
jgi:hypothetical protein